MATKIQWCDETWNPVTGCSPISAGCDHCYAARMAKRLAGRFGYSADDPFKPTLHKGRLDQPSRWKKPRRIFVCSMGDLWHPAVPEQWRIRVFWAAAAAPWHTYLFLTKRPPRPTFIGEPNWWFGVTYEDTPAAYNRGHFTFLQGHPECSHRFISYEPALEQVEWGGVLSGRKYHWLICGAETGPRARPMNLDWARSARDACRHYHVAFFMKSAGPGIATPKDLRIREFPEGMTR